jgi:hypothetical protein
VSIELVVTRSAPAISLSEWMRLVEEDEDLRLRADPYVAINPTTGARILINAGEADAEFHINGRWIPFLRFWKGHLTTNYVEEFDNPENATRLKIAAVARRLAASIRTDAGDEPLS